jgi:hypothetical protein
MPPSRIAVKTMTIVGNGLAIPTTINRQTTKSAARKKKVANAKLNDRPRSAATNCGPECPDGASVNPAKGAALEEEFGIAFPAGPTAQPFALWRNGWPVGPK